MPEANAPAPAAPPAAPVAPAAPAPSRSERLQAAFNEGPPAEAPKAPAAPEVKAEPPATPAPAPAKDELPKGAPDNIKASFEKLTQQRAALREEQERVKPYIEALKVLDPSAIQALNKAKLSGDALGALQALGFTYADVADRIVGTAQKPAPAPQKVEPKVEAPKNELTPEVQEAVAWVAKRKQEEVREKMKASIPAETHPLLTKLGKFEMVEKYIADFHQRTGTLPGDTFAESVGIAAEAVEKDLKAQAEAWSKVLTPAPATPTIPATGTEKPGSGTESASLPRSLTNSATPVATRPEPKTREERLLEALSAG